MRFLLPLIALLAIGCDPAPTKEADKPTETKETKAPDFTGKWTGHIELGEKDKAGLTEEQAKQAEDEAANFVMDLEIRTDGTYAITAPGDEATGTWKQDGDKITLIDSKTDPQNPQDGDSQVLTFENDRLIGREPTGASDSIMVFKRA
jgi:hypothetical protein